MACRRVCGENGGGCAYLWVVENVFDVFLFFQDSSPHTLSLTPYFWVWIQYYEFPLAARKLSVRKRSTCSTSDFSVLGQEPRVPAEDSVFLPRRLLVNPPSATMWAQRVVSLSSYALSFPDPHSYLPDFAQPRVLISVELETGSIHLALGLLVLSLHSWAVFTCLNGRS